LDHVIIEETVFGMRICSTALTWKDSKAVQIDFAGLRTLSGCAFQNLRDEQINVAILARTADKSSDFHSRPLRMKRLSRWTYAFRACWVLQDECSMDV
jgi:hypothetical protein